MAINVGVTERWSDINGVLQCTQILNVVETREQQRFLAVKGTLWVPDQRFFWHFGSQRYTMGRVFSRSWPGADLGVGQGGPGPPWLIQTYTNLQQQTRTED